MPIFPTGRINPPQQVIDDRHAEAFKRHNRRMAFIPQATPPAFDCRALGWEPPIVDQGQCGSCWDFSGCSISTSAFIKGGYTKNDGSFRLAEQYILDCTQNGGCGGDDNVTVLQFAKAKGIPAESDYGPYKGRKGSCLYKPTMKLWQIADWGYCTPAQQDGVASTQDIKNAMVAYGPIGSGIAADDAFMNYVSGVFKGNSRDINHDIVLVGWDDSQGAWILRNSWNTSWGNQGYMLIAYGANSVGSEAVWATAAALPAPELMDWFV